DRDQELVRRALEEHVLAYLVKPVEAHQLGPALLIARAQFESLQDLTAQNASLRQTLQNRKTIERAKGVLMKRHRWTEAEAPRRTDSGVTVGSKEKAVGPFDLPETLSAPAGGEGLLRRVAAILAHTVNNALTAVVGHLELARRQAEPGSGVRAHLDACLACA